jgi:hypothetical protein
VSRLGTVWDVPVPCDFVLVNVILQILLYINYHTIPLRYVERAWFHCN